MIRRLKKTGSVFLLVFAFLLMGGTSLSAQEFYSEISQNEIGLYDRLEYTMVVKGAKKGSYTPPEFAPHFMIVSGPNQSSQTSIINGVMESEIRISYLLKPRKEGVYTLGKASFEVNGKTLYSDAFKVRVKKVSPEELAQQQSKSKEVFIRAELSKTKAYVGEAVVLEYKLYTAVRIGRGNKALNDPNFNGFYSKDLKHAQNWSQVYLNGKPYQVATLSKHLLIPQAAGKQSIEALQWEFQVENKNQSGRDPFGGWFGMGTSYEPRVLSTQKVQIEVIPLPEKGKPQNFSGAVGEFSVSAKQSKTRLQANEGMDVTLRLSGTGNLDLVQLPRPNFPVDFEVYEPKVTEKLKNSSQGVSGYKEWHYLVLPRIKGEYEIPAWSFSYFDPGLKQYKNIALPVMPVQVLPDSNQRGGSAQVMGGGAVKKKVEALADDIRFLQLEMESKPRGAPHWLWIILGLAPLAAGISYGIKIQRKKQESLPLNQQQGKLRKRALSVLKSCEQALNDNNHSKYYQLLYEALEDYGMQRLAIPRSQWNKQTAGKGMEANGSQELAKAYISLLEAVEMARFAPQTNTPTNLHEQAIDWIVDCEKQMKK